ncbi:uncharacterized protein LOC103573028 isoform X2 [Microplitis demolitor]|uniref:uncharacterized protein LOC103573028 isoform X2 n=1 Tax=Microplitis demolitor TaxID=69319 RepID=UPI0004CDDB59|nr:uncharacterized protein LOC103573028 isoform X2 [Microplitis demolitor]
MCSSIRKCVLSEKINNPPIRGAPVRYIRPFKTVQEVDEYDDFSEDGRAKLRHYLSAFCGGQDATETLKFFLKNNLFFVDKLLIAYNFGQLLEKKSNVFLGVAIDHDLFSVMRVMFSTIQSKEYHEALKSALRNADKRVGKKHPQADDAEISPKAKKRSKKRSRPPGFYENPFVKGSSQNTEEFENHEDDNL